FSDWRRIVDIHGLRGFGPTSVKYGLLPCRRDCFRGVIGPNNGEARTGPGARGFHDFGFRRLFWNLLFAQGRARFPRIIGLTGGLAGGEIGGVISSAILGQRFSRQDGKVFIALTRGGRGFSRRRGVGSWPWRWRKIFGFRN